MSIAMANRIAALEMWQRSLADKAPGLVVPIPDPIPKEIDLPPMVDPDDFADLKQMVTAVSDDFGTFKTGFEQLLPGLDAKFGNLTDRLKGIEQRLTDLEKRVPKRGPGRPRTTP